MNRKAAHSGSWYESNPMKLSYQLNEWLSNVNVSHEPARAIISPHAGYQYCGKTAAFAFKQINPTVTKRIFILGPLHHIALQGCGLSMCSFYDTPFLKLKIDEDVYKELIESKQFSVVDVKKDEHEHSLEMQLPYIAHVMRGQDFTIVPILVGATSVNQDRYYGEIFAKYLSQEENCFVISSDFCHWGNRFSYTFTFEDLSLPIFQSIEQLDRMGMDLIARLDYKQFLAYLTKFGNTICGRYPIRILLQAINKCMKKSAMARQQTQLKFLDYSQSNQVQRANESSVSYAAASFTAK